MSPPVGGGGSGNIKKPFEEVCKNSNMLETSDIFLCKCTVIKYKWKQLTRNTGDILLKMLYLSTPFF